MLLPSELLPSLAQHLIVLSLIRAQVLSQLVMAVASVMLGTLTGTDEPLIMPVPSCPLSKTALSNAGVATGSDN